jgi:ABC-type sugar transport system ATPase subunit
MRIIYISHRLDEIGMIADRVLPNGAALRCKSLTPA